jgi:hypothetical protein
MTDDIHIAVSYDPASQLFIQVSPKCDEGGLTYLTRVLRATTRQAGFTAFFSHVTCGERNGVYVFIRNKELLMKTRTQQPGIVEQPRPFTSGLTKAMVRARAYQLYRDKLAAHSLTLEDWVLAEKDLVNSMEAGEDGVAV